MREWRPGDLVRWHLFTGDSDPLYPDCGEGRVYRLLDASVETYDVEVDVTWPKRHRHKRYCYKSSELQPIGDLDDA